MRELYRSPTIVIREFLLSEESLFVNLFNDAEVIKYLPFADQERYAQLFKEALIDYQDGPFGRWGIFITGTGAFVGTCLFRNFKDVEGQMEIGYSLTPTYWGKGLGAEVAAVLTNYGFKATHTREIVAVTDLENVGSQKVLEKVGYQKLENLKRQEEELCYYHISRP